MELVQTQSSTNGTLIANEILTFMRERGERVDFKNVQRRVYDALNVLSALNVVKKGGRSNILFSG